MKEITILIGSSMKHRELIKQTITNFQKINIKAIFPNIDSKPDQTLSFEEKEKLVKDHLDTIPKVDAVYFLLPKGNIGNSCLTELGASYALNKMIFFSEPTNDFGVDCYLDEIIPLDNLSKFKEIFER